MDESAFVVMILYPPLKAIALVLLINENGRYNFCVVWIWKWVFIVARHYICHY